MKKISLVVCLVFMFALLPAAATAQDQTDPVRLDREKRISDRKSRLKLQLAETQKQLYKNKCVPAQTKIQAHLENAKKFSEKNDKKFDDFVTKVTTLVNKLKTSGYDVAGAEEAFNKVKQSNDQVKSAYEKYISGLTDAAQIDCKTDPEGFRASLDDAKSGFTELRKARTQLQEIIKTELKTKLRQTVGQG